MYFLRTDHIGKPVLATDALGVVSSSISHKPFGEVHTSTGLDTGLRFPGQVYHWESELHQNWMRDYDPTTGRYIQADPLGLVDGASVYGYALQSPGRFVDPRGLEVVKESTYWGRFSQCVSSRDPLSNTWKAALTGVGGPVPKSWVGLPKGMKGASPFTTLPSVAAHYATGGKARKHVVSSSARTVGRGGYAAFIGYGLYMLGAEAICACEAIE